MTNRSIDFKLVSQEPDLYAVWADRDEVEFEAGGFSFRLVDSGARFEPDFPQRSIEVIAAQELSEETLLFLVEYESHQAFQAVENFTPTEITEPRVAAMLGHIRLLFIAAAQRVSDWITWKYNLVPENELWPRRYDAAHGDGEKRLYFRLTPGDDWVLAPIGFDRSPKEYVGKIAPQALSELELVELVESLESEQTRAPVAWSMFELAIRMTSDRRVTLVLGAAAAEVALKQCLTSLDSSSLANWAFVEKPSRSWNEMATEALPLVTEIRTTEKKPNVLPREMTKQILSGIKLRNDFVHRGITSIDDGQLEEFMVSVNDLLYTLEWIQGGDWAFAHISKRYQAAWSAPN